MISALRIICILIVMLIIQPQLIIAAQLMGVYGVTIHLNNNKQLDGYIETDVEVYKCKEKKDSSTPWKQTWDVFLRNQSKVRFINNFIEVKYIQFYEGEYRTINGLVVAKSSVKEISKTEIKSIESVCRKWDSPGTFSGTPIITDNMAKIISSNKFVGSYLYNSYELADDTGEPCELCSLETIFLSYNSKYTRKELRKLRHKLYKMSDGELEKEKLVRFFQAWD